MTLTYDFELSSLSPPTFNDGLSFDLRLLLLGYKKSPVKDSPDLTIIYESVSELNPEIPYEKNIEISEESIDKIDELTTFIVDILYCLYVKESNIQYKQNLINFFEIETLELSKNISKTLQDELRNDNFVGFSSGLQLEKMIPLRVSSNIESKFDNDLYLLNPTHAMPFPPNIDSVYLSTYTFLEKISDNPKTPWLKAFKFKESSRDLVTSDGIHTNFNNLPNSIFSDLSRLPLLGDIDARLTPFFISFNVSNQCGEDNSLVEIKIPIWVTIEIGSPNFLLVYQKLEPGEAYHFVINTRDYNLITPMKKPRYNINDPMEDRISFSGFLPGRNDPCCKISDDSNCGEQIFCSSIYKAYQEDADLNQKGICAMDPQTDEVMYCSYPKLDATGEQDPFANHCDPKDPKQKIPLNKNSMCSTDKAQVDHPMCCFAGNSKEHKLGDWNWQTGGGRILIHYVDPMYGTDPNDIKKVNEGTSFETTIRPYPQAIQIDSFNQPIIKENQHLPELGKINPSGVRPYYCQLLEFTVDYFLNTPNKYIPMFSYDASSVDSTTFPTYMKSIGPNNNPNGCDKDQCCLQYIGRPDKKLRHLSKDCPTDTFNQVNVCSKVNSENCINVGQCISLGLYCGLDGNSVDMMYYAGEKSAHFDNDPINNPLCHIFDNFQDQMGEGFQAGLNEYINNLSYIGLNTDEVEEKKRKETLKFLNKTIYGCEWASDENFKDNSCSKIRINDKKCRALNWGVFPSYAGKNFDSLFNSVESENILPPFKCSLGSCPACNVNVLKNSKATENDNQCIYNQSFTQPSSNPDVNLGTNEKPSYVAENQSCCQENTSTFCYGIEANETTDVGSTNPMAYFYKPEYSGLSSSTFSYTKNGVETKANTLPLYNAYSKYVHANAKNVYGYSLDDLIGLSQCDSWALNVVAGPICNEVNDPKEGKICQLPNSTSPPPQNNDKTQELKTVYANFVKRDPAPSGGGHGISFECAKDEDLPCCKTLSEDPTTRITDEIYKQQLQNCSGPLKDKSEQKLYGCYSDSRAWTCDLTETQNCTDDFIGKCRWGNIQLSP